MKYIKTIMKALPILSVVCLSSILNSCDEIEQDTLPDVALNQASDIDINLSKQSPVVIDLLQHTAISEKAGVSIIEQPQKGSVELITSSSLIKYQPDVDFTEGSDFLTYEICIGAVCDEGFVQFDLGESDECSINAVYDAAQAVLGTEQVVLEILTNDEFCQESVDVSTLTIIESPTGGTATADDGLIFYYPGDDFVGTDQLIYSISTKDSPDEISYALAEVTIYEDNTCDFSTAADVLTFTQTEINESNGSLFIAQSEYLENDDFCDLDFSELYVSTLSQPQWGSVKFTHNEGFLFTLYETVAGTYSFSYQVCDGTQVNCSESTVITIEVEAGPADCEILAIDDNFIYSLAEFNAEKTVGTLGYIYYDLDEIISSNDELCQNALNTLTIEVSEEAAFGVIEYFSLETFRYKPGDDFAGSDSFSYTLCDSNGQCSEGKVTITVNDFAFEECQMEATDDNFTYSQTEFDSKTASGFIFFLVDETISNNDELCQNNLNELIIEISKATEHGVIEYFNLEGFRYIPGDSFSGSDSFTYSLCNSDGQCTAATVTISVN